MALWIQLFLTIRYFYPMDYKVVEFYDMSAENREILIAYLSEIGFESFEETDESLKAYIRADAFDPIDFGKEIMERFSAISCAVSTIPKQNWNETWEKNFEPLQIGEVYIRAPFHKSRSASGYELVIEPKMSFGTGHHATTTLMVMEMMKIRFRNKKVLDMGCGTSLLAILASKLGADKVLAVDIDEWAVENSKENCLRNEVSNVDVIKGDAAVIKGSTFDIILANINRNVLLADLEIYSTSLNNGGFLLLSGFYEADMQEIRHRAEETGLIFSGGDVLNQWAVMQFNKFPA